MRSIFIFFFIHTEYIPLTRIAIGLMYTTRSNPIKCATGRRMAMQNCDECDRPLDENELIVTYPTHRVIFCSEVCARKWRLANLTSDKLGLGFGEDDR